MSLPLVPLTPDTFESVLLLPFCNHSNTTGMANRPMPYVYLLL